MIFMEGVIFITDEIITDILNIELKDLEDFSSYSKDGYKCQLKNVQF